MTIAEQLRQLSEAASFTIADMALWCGFDRSAMRQWTLGGHTPHPIRQKQIQARLGLLQATITRTEKLPVPATIKAYDRPNYVKQVLAHALKEFSKSNSSSAGRKDLDQHT